MRRLQTLLALVLLALPALPAAARAQDARPVDVTGRWLFTVDTDAGSGTPTVTFRQKGDSLTGHYSSANLGEAELRGTVKDGKITFSIDVDAGGSPVAVTYTGTVDGADAMKGKVDFAGMGGGTFTAKRQP